MNGPVLTACTVIDEDPSTNPGAATALNLAANIRVPDSMAQAGRIRIKLNVNP